MIGTARAGPSISNRRVSRWRHRRSIGIVGRQTVLPISPWLKASAIGKIAGKFRQIIPVVGSTQVNGHENVCVEGILLRGRTLDSAFRVVHVGGCQRIPTFQRWILARGILLRQFRHVPPISKVHPIDGNFAGIVGWLEPVYRHSGRLAPPLPSMDLSGGRARPFMPPQLFNFVNGKWDGC